LVLKQNKWSTHKHNTQNGLFHFSHTYQNKLFFHSSQCKQLNFCPQHINLLPSNEAHGYLQFNKGCLLRFTSFNFISQYSQITCYNSIILLALCITNCCIYTFLGEGIVHCHNSRCLRPLILLTKLQILRAGPSFRPMYFIIMSELSSSNALPSISYRNNQNIIVISVKNNYYSYCSGIQLQELHDNSCIIHWYCFNFRDYTVFSQIHHTLFSNVYYIRKKKLTKKWGEWLICDDAGNTISS
jgi:hypothetical protein